MFSKKIILDTNFLMIPGMFGIDVFSEIDRIVDFRYQLCFLDGTLRELWNLAEGIGKKSQNAKLAVIMANSKKIKKLSSKGDVDDSLVEYAKKGAIICTQDKELKDRIKKVNGKIITMRSKKSLIME